MTPSRQLVLCVAILSILFGAGVGFVREWRWWNRQTDQHYLRVLALGGVLSQPLVDRFTRQSKVGILLNTVAREDEMRFRLRQMAQEYDVIIATRRQLSSLREAGGLHSLERQKIGGLDHIELDFRRDPEAPQAVYLAPLLWGVNGVLFQPKAFANPPKSLGALFAGLNARRRLGWMRNPYEMAGLLERRRLLEGIENAEIPRQAFYALMRSLSLVVDFDEEPAIEKLRSGQYVALQCSSGRAGFVMKQFPEWQFLLPAEGSTFWVLGAAIPASSKQTSWAERFIDYLLQEEQMHAITEMSRQASTGKFAWPGLPEMAKASYLASIPLGRIALRSPEMSGLEGGEAPRPGGASEAASGDRTFGILEIEDWLASQPPAETQKRK